MADDFFERLSKSSQFDFITEFHASSDHILSRESYTELVSAIDGDLDRNRFIGGIALYGFDGTQLIIIAKNKQVLADFTTTSEIVSSMAPEVFFEELPDKVEEDGLGHLEFDYFEIYFAHIYEKYALAFLVIDHDREKLEKVNTIIEKTRVTLKSNLNSKAEHRSSDTGSDIPNPSRDQARGSSTPIPAPSGAPNPTFGEKAPTPADPEEDRVSSKVGHEAEIEANEQRQQQETPKEPSRDELKTSLRSKLQQLED